MGGNNTYSLTNPQKSIWQTEQFYKNTSIENISGRVNILEKVDFKKFIKAINLCIKRNDSFRLKFFVENDEVKQLVENYSEFSFEKVLVDSEKDVKKIENELANMSFETLNSYLFKFVLYEFPDGHGGFVVTLHHLISDAWSSGFLLSEIIDIYDSLKNNEELSLEEAPSYVEYISSEQEYINSEKFIKDKEYWNDLFATVPEVATIPSLKNISTSCKAKRKQFVLNKSLMNIIHEYCKKYKVSEFNFFMAVLSIYLGRVSSQDEFVIGTPILNRSNFREKHTSGMFISVIPFKISIQDLTFSDFVSNISKDFLSIFRHQKYPYQTLLEDIRKEHGNNIPNLYNVMFSYQNMRSNKQTAKTNYETNWLFSNNISDDLDVHLYDINDTGDNLIAYDFKVDKYDIDDIYSIHARILHIINQILENENISLKDIEIVTPDEKKKLLYDFNNTKLDYPKDKTIAELFQEQALKTPDNTAVVFGDEKITYKELNEKANSLAEFLREQGINRNDMVGIMVPKAGGTYIPIDPEYPQDRIEYMLDNSNAKLLLSFESLKNKVNFEKTVYIELDKEVYNLSKANLDYINKPDDLAYVIYTSGSTGKPKGVMISNRNVNNFIQGMCKEINFAKSKTIVCVTTISFDIFVLETLLPLLKGLKIVIANEEEQNDANLFNELCIKNNVKIVQTTPSRYQILIDNSENPEFLNNLTDILVGGESVPKTLVQKFKKLTNANIYNVYGPTETTVWSTVKDLTNEDAITIGHPIANTTCYILDNNKKLLPCLTPGNLYIGGDGLSKGYLNNSELTNSKFIKSPFNNNELIYDTGDIAYINNNGELIHMGRNDFQVKINGHRIELEEIENAILKNKEIKNCIVVKKASLDNREFLCAYYISNTEIDISGLRSMISKDLPIYMVPQHFIKLDEFPYTPNGKIDRKKLPLPDSSVNNKKKIVGARNDIDNDLINILQELLEIENISIDDSFFELGGDSLSAINLCAKIYSEFNVQLFAKDILETPVIKDLSDLIASKNKATYGNKVKNVSSSSYYEASSAQSRIYFATSLATENLNLYNISGGLILDKMPDTKKLNDSFKKLILRHPSLRTSFDIKDGKVVQEIKDDFEFNLNILNKAISESNIDNEFKEFDTPFDLSKAPLLKTSLVKLDSGKAFLMVSTHHIVCDGTSLSILINDLCKIYNGETLEELKYDYKDYSSWEQNENYEEAEKYWTNLFSDEIPVLALPTKPRPSVQSFAGDKIYTKIDNKLFNRINKMSQKYGVTPYMILLTAYYFLLYKYTSQEDIVVGSPIVNRNRDEFSNVIGMFVNSLALKNHIDSNLSFEDNLNNIKENCFEAYKYQDYPFDKLVNKLNIPRDTSRNPLFDTMFVYQNNGYGNGSFKGINSKTYIPNSKISKFDLSLEIIPNNDEFEFSFEYCTNLFDKSFIENLANHYINITKAILENPDIKVADIDMLSNKEKNKIIYEFNKTDMDYPKDKTISQLFEEQVEKTPDNIAVVFENKKLTYKELNEKANSLAYYLRNEKNITRNDIIGIMVNRSLEMVVSILAVLKAGGAYVLIDSSLPFDRIEYILDNCKAKLLLSDNDYSLSFKNIININKIPKNKIDNLNIINIPNDTFAVIYTSGSTGKPKGVVLTHIGLINLVYSFGKILDLFSMKNHLGVSSVSFDMFMVELFSCILLGRTLYLLNEEEQRNPSLVSNCIIKNKIEFLITTPTKMELLLSNNETAKCLKQLKGFQLGGEVFTPLLYEKLKKYTNAKIYNGYGPTEITACCSNKLVTSKENINIGTSNPNTQIYILDKDLNPCPIGVPGELYVAGLGVSKGYINDLEKTNKSFVDNIFGPGKMYKTGDLAKFNDFGEIEYIGRNDFQVKLKGLRIELSEIEKQLLKIEYITNCAVITNKEKTMLKAFFTATEELNIPNIRKQLSDALPTYMVPNYIFQIDSMPITQNGKIDRNKLDEYKCNITNEEITYVEPENEMQKLFCDIWENILQTKVGIDNDIFELGADSLSAIKFKVELLTHNIDIPYADIFKYKTIRKLSQTKQKNIETMPIESYDYSKIDSILKSNKQSLNYKIENNKNNNILLFGSNGFVGMHIINSFIKNDTGKIYCVMRDKNNSSALERFTNTLKFYFDDSLNNYINDRIFIIKGDISKENFGMTNATYNEIINNISIVINAAANVKHYGNFDKFKSINIDSTVNVINFCKKYRKRLLHLSTLSISGNTFLDGDMSLKDINKADKVYFSENNLFINQSLDNVYTRSKFEAEKIVLDNISEGLNAIILRLGNITSRYIDGKFQINPDENAFTNRLKSVMLLGVIPKTLLEQEVEFTPVDLCADAIIKVVQNNCKKISVLHIFNSNHIKVDKILSILKGLNVKIGVVSENEFTNIIDKSIKDAIFKKQISGIINDLTPEKKLKYSSNIKIKSNFSTDYLSKCKFKWKKIDKTYIQKYFNYLKNIEFFKEV